MKNVFIFGISGKMGKMLTECAADYGYNVCGGFDKTACAEPPVFTCIDSVNLDMDVILDFSNPALLPQVIALAKKSCKPVVLATTGYSDEQIKEINELSKLVPVFRSGTLSLGIAAAKAASLAVKKVLGDDFDIEIVEKHHNRKLDNPSGTALILADALAPRSKQVVNRYGKRNKGELGITSVRGGGTVGVHEIGFYGEDETLTIMHTAHSRKLFAAGAFRAADFLLTCPVGMYDMDDYVNSLLK